MKHLKKPLLIIVCCAIAFTAILATVGSVNNNITSLAAHYDDIEGPF